MTNIDNFKSFVKKNPNLIKYVNDNEMTWQKFYEMYDLYGEEDIAWNKYLKVDKEKKETRTSSKNNISEIIGMVKNMDVDKVQDGISSLQKAIGLFGDLIVKKDTPSITNYTPRQVYKRFED